MIDGIIAENKGERMKNIEFDETFMSSGDTMVKSSVPGFGHGNKIPSTSRAARTRLKVTKEVKPASKGLARSCVSVNWTGNTATVRVKGSLTILGTLRRSGKSYGYNIPGDKHQGGFTSQRQCLSVMLGRS